MTFAAVINELAAQSSLQQNILTDNHATIHYHQIPSLLASIDHYLNTNGISNNQCVALECTNSLPAALTLLYLLQKQYRFMLLPPTSKKETAAALSPLPTFCQYQLTFRAAQHAAQSDGLLSPQNFLHIAVNEHYQAEQHAASPTQARLYLRTSGSMGKSKIVVHTHDNLLNNARNCTRRFQLTATARVMIAVPIFHMYGLGAGFLPSFMAGASIDLQENTNLLRYVERERQFQPNAAFLTPALCDMLLQRRGGSRIYKVAVSAGARLKEDIVRAFDERFGALVNLYGSTELGAVSAAAPDADLEVRATTIGWAMQDVALVPASYVREQAPTDAPVNWNAHPDAPLTDEAYCRHPWGYEGYVDDDGHVLSAAATWFKTGDMATFQPDGSIQILGRADNSVNRDGHLVLLADIERMIETIDAIAAVVVLATQAERQRGHYIAAFCVVKAGMSLDNAQIRTACFSMLPRYAVPDDVFTLDALPRLPSGKVDRQALSQLASVSATEASQTAS